jgi:hypothetical protein
VTRRRGWRRKKLLDRLEERRGYSHLKEEALDRTMWRNRFGGSFEHVVRQNTEWMNKWMSDWMNVHEIRFNKSRVFYCGVTDGQTVVWFWDYRISQTWPHWFWQYYISISEGRTL